MGESIKIPDKFITPLIGAVVIVGLYLTSLYSYLLFHSLSEIFGIAVAFGIFMMAWNSRRFMNNSYFLFISIAYLFIGSLDLLHTLSYSGMGVFKGYTTNLPTQLWISTRYIESLTLFGALFFLNRKLKTDLVWLLYLSITAFLLASIFYWNIFPDCFIEGSGLTPFKKTSEYIISLILVATAIFLYRKREHFDNRVFSFMLISILATVISELAFTFYVHAYGISNLIGHYFKIISFYFIYKAIIETGLTQPYNLLFRDLKKTGENLQRELFINSAIAELSDVLISRWDSIEEITAIILDQSKLLTGSDFGYVSSIEAETGDNVSHTLTEMMKGQCKLDEKNQRIVFPISEDGTYSGLWGHSLNTHEPFFSNSPSAHKSSQGLPEKHVPIDAFLSVPVLVEGKIAGQIALANPGRDYTEEDIDSIERLGELYGLALQRKQAEDELKRYRDNLEELVQDRTIEIRSINVDLAREIELHRETQKKKEEAEEELEKQRTLAIRSDRLRSLGEMAAGIAHELNQPVVGVRGLAEHISLAIKRGWDLPEEEILNMANLIVEQADRISHVIEHTRKFARGAASPELLPVDVNDVIHAGLGLIGSQLKTHGFILEYKLEENLPPILANPFSLEEVLLNLINNARDSYTEVRDNNSTRPITVRTCLDENENNKYVKIEISDKGGGIPENVIERIFEPFFTTKDPDKGTGLGLAISMSIIESFDGKIDIQTAANVGTTVNINIPVLIREGEDQ